jgi:transposase-like protein
VARTCRRYGISRKTFYLWRSRYNAEDVTSAAKLLHYCDFTCYTILVGLQARSAMRQVTGPEAVNL